MPVTITAKPRMKNFFSHLARIVSYVLIPIVSLLTAMQIAIPTPPEYQVPFWSWPNLLLNLIFYSVLFVLPASAIILLHPQPNMLNVCPKTRTIIGISIVVLLVCVGLFAFTIIYALGSFA